MTSKRHPVYNFIEVYDNGTIVSHRQGEEGPMKVAVNKQGYIQTAFDWNGKKRYIGIHRLVAETFLTRPGLEYTVDHLDRNKFNNHLSNLRYVKPKTQKANRGKRFYK